MDGRFEERPKPQEEHTSKLIRETENVKKLRAKLETFKEWMDKGLISKKEHDTLRKKAIDRY